MFNGKNVKVIIPNFLMKSEKKFFKSLFKITIDIKDKRSWIYKTKLT